MVSKQRRPFPVANVGFNLATYLSAMRAKRVQRSPLKRTCCSSSSTVPSSNPVADGTTKEVPLSDTFDVTEVQPLALQKWLVCDKVTRTVQFSRPAAAAAAGVDYQTMGDSAAFQDAQQTRCRAEREIAIACVVNVSEILLIAAHAGI